MPMLDTYIFFNGNCGEAMRFYESALGGKMQTFMTYAQSPHPEQCAALTPEDGKRIMHACLIVDGRMLMASDTPPGMTHQPMSGFALSVNYDTPEEARRTFDKLAEGATVTMPIAKTFWAEAYGMLTDRFGTPWMVGGGLIHPGEPA